MTHIKLLHNLLAMDENIIDTFIKPKQLSILKKQLNGKRLSENEKRYLRGNLRKKLEFLGQFQDTISGGSEHQWVLNIINSYYITGLAALRYNGFGWYYIPKIIEIINTRLEGKIRLNNVTLKFFRVRSINYNEVIVDEQTGLKYATNDQIIKDVKYTKNEYTSLVWKNMLNRYGKQFVEDPEKYSEYVHIEEAVDYSKFGV